MHIIMYCQVSVSILCVRIQEHTGQQMHAGLCNVIFQHVVWEAYKKFGAGPPI